MANEAEVRKYLAYWFQAGKRVLLEGGDRAYCPKTVVQGDRYSQEFEECWQHLRDPKSGDCFLEGTRQTIQDLLSPGWDVTSCARCGMPVPMITLGISNPSCPCSDMESWPNTELPQPRNPVNNQHHLTRIRDRVENQKHKPVPRHPKQKKEIL